MTDGERMALFKRIIASQERTLQLFRQLRIATYGTPLHEAVLAADRAQIGAQQATVAIREEGSWAT